MKIGTMMRPEAGSGVWKDVVNVLIGFVVLAFFAALILIAYYLGFDLSLVGLAFGSFAVLLIISWMIGMVVRGLVRVRYK